MDMHYYVLLKTWVATGCLPKHCTIDGKYLFTPDSADENRVIEITAPKSINGNQPIEFDFFNGAGEDVTYYWHDYSGNRQYYGMIAAGETIHMHTYATHPWSFDAEDNTFCTVGNGDAVFIPTAWNIGKTIVINK